MPRTAGGIEQGWISFSTEGKSCVQAWRFVCPTSAAKKACELRAASAARGDSCSQGGKACKRYHVSTPTPGKIRHLSAILHPMPKLTFATVMAATPEPIIRGWFGRLTRAEREELLSVRKEFQKAVAEGGAPSSQTFAKAIKKVSSMKLPHHRTLAEWLRNDS